jgi:TPR repeat protein
MTSTTLIISAICFLVLMACMFIASTIAHQKRERREKRRQEIAYRKAMQQARAQEHSDKVFKAETGHIATQLYLAKEAERNQPKEALYWYEKAAMQDNEIAMRGIVRVCQRAQSDPIYQKKAQFWQLAIRALQGSNEAKVEKAIALIEGLGVDISLEKGIQEMQEVAELGYVDAIIYMGDWCQSPKNSERSYPKAATWFRRAAKMQSTVGMIRLGELYEHGKGVPLDIGKAGYWYELAGEKGDVNAQYRAGCLWSNAGVHTVAYVWLFMAAKSGHAESVKQRDVVASAIGVDVIVGLQALAKPLHQKIAKGDVVKHSIIKALNKLYSRPIYFPEVTAKTAETDSKLADSQVTSAGDATQVGAQTEQVSHEQPTGTSNTSYALDQQSAFGMDAVNFGTHNN